MSAPIADGGLDIAAVEQAASIARATLRIRERRYGFPRPVRDPRGESSGSCPVLARHRMVGVQRMAHVGDVARGRLLARGARRRGVSAFPHAASPFPVTAAATRYVAQRGDRRPASIEDPHTMNKLLAALITTLAISFAFAQTSSPGAAGGPTGGTTGGTAATEPAGGGTAGATGGSSETAAPGGSTTHKASAHKARKSGHKKMAKKTAKH